MSVKMMARVWDLALEQTEKMTLLAMADFADDDGVCYPSVGRIAYKCGKSERQTQRIFSRLRSKELIVILRPGGGRKATTYQVRPENGKQLPEYVPAKYEDDMLLDLN
jgi:hypothetical protein